MYKPKIACLHSTGIKINLMMQYLLIYDILESTAITLEYKVYFAAATCFCPKFDVFGNPIVHGEFDLPMLYISVIPDENHTMLIFSWFKEDHYVYSFFR